MENACVQWTNDGNMSIDIHVYYAVHVHVYMYMHAQNSHKQCSINQKSFELPPLRFNPSTLSMHVYNFYGITTVSLLKGIVLSLIMHAYVHRSMHLYSVCAKHMYITVCSLSMHPRVCTCVCVQQYTCYSRGKVSQTFFIRWFVNLVYLGMSALHKLLHCNSVDSITRSNICMYMYTTNHMII